MNRVFQYPLLGLLAASGLYAQQIPVKMSFSGNGGASPINLKQPNTNTADEDVAGIGTLGAFTFRNVSAETAAPSSQPPSTCSGPNLIFFSRVAGAGIFRFGDGSLLNVKLIQGSDCIDLAAQVGHCTLTFQITGGTGRFQNASGMLTYTETSLPVLADASNNPVFFTEAGQITGTISRVAAAEDVPQ